MAIKLVVDSCCDLDDALRARTGAIAVPLTMHVDGRDFIDVPELDTMEFIEAMEASPNVTRSSCPSPAMYAEQFAGDDQVICITLSDRLSGSYASAMTGRSLISQPENVFVLDSKTACAGETLLAIEASERIKAGMPFSQLVEHMVRFVKEANTLFVLDSTDALVKNGRMPKLAGKLISVLNLKLVLQADEEGEIGMIDRARGLKKAIERIAEVAMERQKVSLHEICSISHVHNLEMANLLKSLLEKTNAFKEIVIVQTRGLSSLYASRNGVVMAF